MGCDRCSCGNSACGCSGDGAVLGVGVGFGLLAFFYF